MRPRWKWLGFIGLSGVVVVAAGVLALSNLTTSSSRARSDLEDVLPLSSQPPDMVARYHYVEDHPNMAKQVPCYCGCGKSLGHRYLLDCFVIKAGVYSDHASGCMVCDNEADDMQRMTAEGRSATEIRDYIDTQYSKYGPPTNTPKRGN